MEKNKFNGFESKEKYEGVEGMIKTALMALTDTTAVEYIEKTQVLTIYAGYDDYTLTFDLNIFDGLYSVVKTDEDGNEIAYFDKRDLDLIRRVDFISEDIMKIVYTKAEEDE